MILFLFANISRCKFLIANPVISSSFPDLGCEIEGVTMEGEIPISGANSINIL